MPEKTPGSPNLPKETEAFATPAIEFVFDPERKLFVLGSGEGEQTLDPTNIGALNDILRALAAPPDGIELLVAQKDLLFRQSPEFRKRLIGMTLSLAQETALLQEVSDAMNGVREMWPRTINPRRYKGYSDLRIDQTGRIFLDAGSGDCLIPSRSQDRYATRSYYLPFIYDIHNAESPQLRAPLLAGLGTLAWIAKKRGA